MALRELCSPAWLCHTCEVERPLGTTGGSSRPKELPLWCHPVLGTHVGIHSAMRTPFEAPRLKRPEETWVNIPTVWSRL